jgi:hypothetical protein
MKIFVTNSAAEERDRDPNLSIGCLLCARAAVCAGKQLGIRPVHRPRTNRPGKGVKPMLVCGSVSPKA